MSYHVQVEAYQGPFDLLLSLVTQKKIDVSAISITEIADQYLAEVERMSVLDLDVASDFLVVAATLLEVKAASLVGGSAISADADQAGDAIDPARARDILVDRLVAYKQMKDAAAALEDRMRETGKMHARHAGLEPQFCSLVPDFLEGITLHNLAVICADLLSRREAFLLDAEHIASAPISMERHLEEMYRTMRARGSASFSEMLGDDTTPEVVVVSLLAVLELYKRGVVSVAQESSFGDIELVLEDDAPEICDFSVPEWGIADEGGQT